MLFRIILTFIFSIRLATSIGEKAFQACKDYATNLLECKNILDPRNRVRVPIDLLLYPHMVLIGFRESNREPPIWKCGGTLVSPNWVLTAAHCREDPLSGPASDLRVGTATFEFDETEDLVQERKVAERITHPGYRPPLKYNDIELMRPDRPFILNRDIRIACLQINNDIGDHDLMAIGFGTTMPGAASGSKTLMKVPVDIIDNSICNKSMKPLIKRKSLSFGILDGQLCAGDYDNGGRDTCQGDSGGPLQYIPYHVDCVSSFPLHHVVGVTSFGRDCGRKKAPGVYTRVSYYIEWIESIVWP